MTEAVRCVVRCPSVAADAAGADVSSSSVVQHDVPISPFISAVRAPADKTPVRRHPALLPQVGGGGGRTRRGGVDVHRHGVVVAGDQGVSDGRETPATRHPAVTAAPAQPVGRGGVLPTS